MEARSAEQILRRAAIRRRLDGEKRHTICDDLDRSPRWYHAVYHPPALEGRTPAEMRRGPPSCA